MDTSSSGGSSGEPQPMRVVVALDLGSSSIRCSAYQIIGEAVGGKGTSVRDIPQATSVRKLRTVDPNGSGRILLQTEEGTSLLDEIDGIVDDVLGALRALPESLEVVGLGFSTFSMNLIALNNKGVPVGMEATLSYACNTNHVAEECRWLKSYLGAERLSELYQRTGAPLHSSYALAQLRHFYAQPENAFLVKQITIWQTLASTLMTRWRGTPFSHVSYSEASWTGLFNFRTCEWDKEAVSLLPEECKNHMPPLSDFNDDVMPSGGVRPEVMTDLGSGMTNPYWNRWPELRGGVERNSSPRCRLFFGLGDGACANVGSNCFTNQRFAVTIGTSAAARVCIPLRPNASFESFHVPDGLFCYRLDKTHVVVGGALTDGGSVVEWARDLLSLNDDRDFEAVMAEVEQILNEDYESCATESDIPHPSALVVAPFLSGERSIGYRDRATFTMMGLTRSSTKAHFVKACLEGVVLRLESILCLLREGIDLGKRQPRIVVTGNAMERNHLWRQMLADCSGLQVQYDTATREGTCRGVAIMSAMALTMERDMAHDSSAYFTSDSYPSSSPGPGAGGGSIYCSPRMIATEGYWLVAKEDQENMIDAVSTVW